MDRQIFQCVVFVAPGTAQFKAIHCYVPHVLLPVLLSAFYPGSLLIIKEIKSVKCRNHMSDLYGTYTRMSHRMLPISVSLHESVLCSDMKCFVAVSFWTPSAETLFCILELKEIHVEGNFHKRNVELVECVVPL